MVVWCAAVPIVFFCRFTIVWLRDTSRRSSMGVNLGAKIQTDPVPFCRDRIKLSCGATWLDAFAPTLCMLSHTGSFHEEPFRLPYSARGISVRPRKSIQPAGSCRDPTIRGSLCKARSNLLLFLIGFNQSNTVFCGLSTVFIYYLPLPLTARPRYRRSAAPSSPSPGRRP